ncbi:MAG: replication/maintenance protein RepL [Methylococcaceae bacterium]
MNYKEYTTRNINDITGEMTYSSTVVSYESKLPNEPAYIKLYIEDIGRLCDLTRGEIRVLVKLVARVGYDGKVLLPLGVKRAISEELECSLSAVSNALTALTNSGIIARIDGGVYGLNPNYFARGKWRDIYEQRKSLRITIDYTDDGGEGKREIITEQIGADIIQMPAQTPAE